MEDGQDSVSSVLPVALEKRCRRGGGPAPVWPPPTQEQGARGGHVTTVALATTAESLDSEQKFVCKITSCPSPRTGRDATRTAEVGAAGSTASRCEMLFCRGERLALPATSKRVSVVSWDQSGVVERASVREHTAGVASVMC